MNTGFGVGAVLLVGTGAAFFMVKPTPADVYDMPVNAAYAKLARADFSGHNGDAIHSSGNGQNAVTWEQHGSFAAFSCNIHLDPLPDNAAKTKVAVNCDGGSAASGASEGMLHAMIRNEYIERVDATLNGRAFSKELAQGATASRWPGDGVDGSIGTAVGKAVQMQADVAREQNRVSQEVSEARAEHEANTPDSAQGAEPAPAN